MHTFSSTLYLLLRRIAAFLYDCLLLVALFFLLTALAVALNDGQAIQHGSYYFALLFVSFLFFDGFWRHGGQTLGMRAWRLKVESTNDEKITFKRSAIRFVSGTFLFGFTLFFAFASPTRQALHDTLSKTKIVRHYK